MTLLDSLDMLPLIYDDEEFKSKVDYISTNTTFNVPSTVQVFETTIRGMGGLLSAHLYASVPRLGHAIDGYDGSLLKLAYDLGERLLHAFITDTGLPAPRVNFQHGYVPIGNKHITETCSSGAGSLLLEFGLLSRLTGDERFEKAARRAFFQIWARRSSKNLIGMSIDCVSGEWLSPITGNGASIDSYYEYALKYYILFGDESFLKIFSNAYKALNIYSFDGWKYSNVDMNSGQLATTWVDSLAAFFPSVQTLYGDIESAERNHLVYYKLWNAYAGLPERWNFYALDPYSAVNLEWYPLRPEFIESNYYLYRATKDPIYLQIGRKVIDDLNNHYRTKCGFSGMQDVRTGLLSDRMESFFLTETTKYLYLLFNDSHPLNSEISNFVFSTEAHPLWYDREILERASASAYPKVWKFVHSRMDDEDRVQEIEQKRLIAVEAVDFNLYGLLKLIRNIVLLPFNALIFAMNAILNGFMKAAVPFHKLFFTFDWSKSDVVHSYNGGAEATDTFSRGFTKISNDSAIQRTFEELVREIRSPPVCKALEHKSGFGGIYSNVASLPEFYTLDQKYIYQTPEWLDFESQGGERKPIEFSDDFYDVYVQPNSTCSAVPRSRTLRVDVEIPAGSVPAKLKVSRIESNIQIIRATSLNGVRLTIQIDNYGPKQLRKARVLKFHEYQVDGLILLDKWLYSNSRLLAVEKDRVYVRGVQVINMMVRGG